MPVTSSASTIWNGDLEAGSGRTRLTSSGKAQLDIDWRSRASGGDKTTPEELLAAAHASCFSMALAHTLAERGTPPVRLEVEASVAFQPGKGVLSSVLSVRASMENISSDEFHSAAEDAKENCPVSKALAGIHITLGGVQLLPAEK